MNDLVPMPPNLPASKPSVFGRMIPTSMRSTDANAFTVQAGRMRSFLGVGTFSGFVSAGSFFVMGGTPTAATAAAVSFGMVMFGTAVVMLFSPPDVPTMALPTGKDSRSLPMLAREMVRITEQGLADVDRARVQKLIDDASEQIRLTLGADAWTFVRDPARSGPGIYVDGIRLGSPPKPESLGRKGVVIRDRLPDVDRIMGDTGADRDEFRATVGIVASRVAGICADFGLDPSGFAERERILPGMRARAIEQLPQLDADARRLADEWLGGDRDGVDPMLRIDADRAAGQELETLSRAWKRARASATPETLDAIDADMREGCRRICATLTTAIGARGRSDRDALGTQKRYLETKHGDADVIGEE